MTFEPYQVGTTLREAYYRYKAEAELDAQQPGPFGNETEPVDDETEPQFACRYCAYLKIPNSEEPCRSCIRAKHYGNGDWTRPNFVREAR
jgi:hypothetical protein